jgi:hypothetical protein
MLPSPSSEIREREFAFLKKQFLREGHKAGVVFE